MQLRAKLDALADHYSEILSSIVPSGSVCLTDYPDYPNVGDSAIFLGQLRWLGDVSRDVCRVDSIGTYSRPGMMKALSRSGSGAILINGGGNIAVGYEHHDRHRRRIAKDFPGSPKVQLPQSLSESVESQAGIRRSLSIFSATPRFSLTLRDATSVRLAERLGVRATLCPDAAHLLGKIDAPPAVQPYVILRRQDHERLGGSTGESYDATDWIDWSGRRLSTRVLRRAAGTLPGVGKWLNPSPVVWQQQAETALKRGIALLSVGETVITDRLHGALLAMQMGRKVIVLPSGTGKVANYLETWFGDASGLPVEFADSIDEAVGLA